MWEIEIKKGKETVILKANTHNNAIILQNELVLRGFTGVRIV